MSRFDNVNVNEYITIDKLGEIPIQSSTMIILQKIGKAFYNLLM